MTTLLLVHGGLWDDMDAEGFWHRPGIVEGLRRKGFDVLAPDRARRPASWAAEVEHLAPALPDHPVTVLAGSNGCSAAALLALAYPNRVERLLLAWPASANDPVADARSRTGLAALGAGPDTVSALLTGDTLRGLTDPQLIRIACPVGVLPSVPDNPTHRRSTVDALLALLPRAVELAGCPEPPQPDFPPHLESLVGTLSAAV